jgi:hypothetical protein
MLHISWKVLVERLYECLVRGRLLTGKRFKYGLAGVTLLLAVARIAAPTGADFSKSRIGSAAIGNVQFPPPAVNLVPIASLAMQVARAIAEFDCNLVFASNKVVRGRLFPIWKNMNLEPEGGGPPFGLRKEAFLGPLAAKPVQRGELRYGELLFFFDKLSYKQVRASDFTIQLFAVDVLGKRHEIRAPIVPALMYWARLRAAPSLLRRQ